MASRRAGSTIVAYSEGSDRSFRRSNQPGKRTIVSVCSREFGPWLFESLAERERAVPESFGYGWSGVIAAVGASREMCRRHQHNPMTSTGVECPVCEPSPSWQYSLLPQHQTESSISSAQEHEEWPNKTR